MMLLKPIKYTAIFSCLFLALCANADSVRAIQWGDCAPSQFNNNPKYQCAKVTVPLDYRNPSIGVTTLAVVKYKKYDSASKPLFINAGGPWVSLSSESKAFEKFSDDIYKTFFIVYFDPRGVGLSESLHDCSTQLPPVPGSIFESSNFKSTFNNFQNNLSACFQAESNPVKYYMSTENTAQDMNTIRLAAGYNQISYIGSSYGTQLGSVYLSLYPNTVDKMILDGNMNPAHQAQSLFTGSAAGYQKALNYLFDRCEQNPSCVLYPNPRQSYALLLSHIESGSVVNQLNTSQVILPQDFYNQISPMLMELDTYPLILDLIADGLSTNAIPVMINLPTTITKESLVYSAVMGGDYKKEGLENDISALSFASQYWNQNSLSSYQILTSLPYSENLLGCYNHLPNHPLPDLTYPSTINPVLIIGNYYDPTTVYSNSVAMNKIIPNSVLLSFNGAGHTALAYFTNANYFSCIDNYAYQYLLTGVTPPPGTVCSALIDPSSLR
ncbi:MAG: alpha/beta fold hydrolase [Coxiellaceae bacterium]|nr:alpha/beta fold hydrolase [Coxiellaceae bacterium]